MTILKIFGAFSLFVLSQIAHSISREDVLECGLPKGDQFVLKAKYSWSPFAKIIPGDVAERLNQENWSIYFKRKTGSVVLTPAFVSHSYGVDACRKTGMIGLVPIVNSSYLRQDGTWFPTKLLPSKLNLSPTVNEQEFAVSKKLQEMGVSPELDFALVFPRNGQIFYEIALLNFKDYPPNGKVVAVYQSISIDSGKTWSDPIITKKAEIYELGKSTSEQSFIARPLTLNGKTVCSELVSRNVVGCQ